PFERRPRRQSHRLRQFLDGRAAVALKRGENLDVDLIQCWRALGGHEVCVLRCAAISFSERVPCRPRARGDPYSRGGGYGSPLSRGRQDKSDSVLRPHSSAFSSTGTV